MTADEIELPVALRIAQAGYRVIQRIGVEPLPINRLALEARAMAQTGLSAFGEPDHRPGLDRYLAAMESTAQLSLLGRVVIRAFVTERLSNQLRIQDFVARHPDVREQVIRRPLIVIGLPRTGSTLLHNLLTLSTGGRAPRMWEVMTPAPPPRPDTRDTDPRIAKVDAGLAQLHRLNPAMKKMHPLGATYPEECFFLLFNAFQSLGLHAFGHIPDYDRWLLEQELGPVYRYHKLQLQLLQYELPTAQWVLKSPVHLQALDALLAAYPDACIVQTHRDPKKVIGSYCSLLSTTQRLYTRRFDPKAIGPHFMETWARALELTAAARDRNPAAPIFDLQYHDLMRDPLAAVRSLHAHFKLPFAPGGEDALRTYLAANPKDKHGAHRYDLEHYGLTAADVDRRYAAYRERYAIPLEG